jgi:subtilisin family serine protease
VIQRQSSQESTTTISDAVRIAILDTGVDGNHPDIYSHWKQIKKVRSWVGEMAKTIYGDGEMSQKVIRRIHQDENGHGTHTTALVLKIAPTADIFIARIAKKDEKLVKENEQWITEVMETMAALVLR